jgi:hypothetical protein
VLDEGRLFAVPEAPRQATARHGELQGVALARGDDRVVLVHRRCQLGDVVVVVLARDPILELAHPAAQRASELRQPLRPEDQERSEQDEHDLGDSDIWHNSEGTTGPGTAPGSRYNPATGGIHHS